MRIQTREQTWLTNLKGMNPKSKMQAMDHKARYQRYTGKNTRRHTRKTLEKIIIK